MLHSSLNIGITLDFFRHHQNVPLQCGNALLYWLSKTVSFFNAKPGIGYRPVSRFGGSGGVAAKRGIKHGDTARVSF